MCLVLEKTSIQLDRICVVVYKCKCKMFSLVHDQCAAFLLHLSENHMKISIEDEKSYKSSIFTMLNGPTSWPLQTSLHAWHVPSPTSSSHS